LETKDLGKVTKRSRVTGRGQRLKEGDLLGFLIVEHSEDWLLSPLAYSSSQVVGSRALV
jgi:hypothetical protein